MDLSHVAITRPVGTSLRAVVASDEPLYPRALLSSHRWNAAAQLQPYPLLRVTLADRFGTRVGRHRSDESALGFSIDVKI